jgi:adenylylsulfate kinase-like enzyme
MVAEVATVVATATTVVVAHVVAATRTQTARVVGLIAHRALAVHVTVALQTPKHADGGSHRLI